MAWLIGLFGLPQIVLGKHERLEALKRPVQIGSIDIIAVDRRTSTLLLAACTLGPVREQDLSNLATATEVLRRDLVLLGSYRVLPVLFTAGAKGSLRTGIRVVDAVDLENLLLMLRQRREEEFLSYLINLDAEANAQLHATTPEGISDPPYRD